MTQLEVFTAVTMKNSVFWDVAPCRYFVNRRFGGMYRLHLQGIRNPRAINQREQVARKFLIPWRLRGYIPPKRRLPKYLHGATSKKTAFLNITSCLDLTKPTDHYIQVKWHSFYILSCLGFFFMRPYSCPLTLESPPKFTYLALLLFTLGRAVLHRSLKSGEWRPSKKRTQTCTLARSNHLGQHYVPSVLFLLRLDAFVCFD
jgi:hypothetical protein